MLGARRLKRPALKILGKPASRVSACFEHCGPATAVFNEKKSPSRQSSPLRRSWHEPMQNASTMPGQGGIKWRFSRTRAHCVRRYLRVAWSGSDLPASRWRARRAFPTALSRRSNRTSPSGCTPRRSIAGVCSANGLGSPTSSRTKGCSLPFAMATASAVYQRPR